MAAPPQPSPSEEAATEVPKVLYVMGAGRSGSTILGVTLGNCERVVFAGELDKWPLRKGVPKLEGEQIERFWSQVLARVDGAQELFAMRTHRYLERSSALLRPRRWLRARAMRARYRAVNEALYRAIAEVAGASHVVDTGHYPLRARELQALDGIELYLLLLVRDPRGVVASFARTDAAERRFGTLTTNLYLWLTHLLSVATFLRQPRERRLLVRHEDFLARPEEVLGTILAQTHASPELPDLGKLRVGVPLMGNRLINAEVVSLERGARPAHSGGGSASGRQGGRNSSSGSGMTALLTSVMQAPWTLVFSLLGPRARSAAA
ncbi:MAG TPA: sulfotransferase [Solirubrobacteraceae bacterium]|jgi:hypothetical protein